MSLAALSGPAARAAAAVCSTPTATVTACTLGLGRSCTLVPALPPPHLRVDERRAHPHSRRLQPGAAHSNVDFHGRPLVAQALQLRLQGRGVAHWSVGGARGGCVPGLAIRMDSVARVIAVGCAASGCKAAGSAVHLGPHAGTGLAGSCCRFNCIDHPHITICSLAHPAMHATAAPPAALPAALPRAPLRRPAAAAAIPALPFRRALRPATQRPLIPVTAASSSADGPRGQQPSAGDNPILEQVVQVERQNERGLAYGALALLLGGAGLALLAVPQRCVEFLWAATPSVLVAGITRNFGSVLLLAAVCAHCLKEAAEHARMQSETYLRLNLGLLWWGLGSAVALWLAPAQPLRMGQGLMTALLLATAWHAGLTFQETDEHGFKPGYLFKQFLRSLGNLGSYSNMDKSAIVSLYVYGLAAKAAIAAAAAHLLEGKMRIMTDGLLLAPLGSLGASLLPLVGVGYLLVALVLFIQKDAARRGRLGASTFKMLNAGLAVVGLSHAASLGALWQAGVLAHTKLAAAKIALQGSLAAFVLFNYACAKK